MSDVSRIFVIGASGAQGIPVVRGLTRNSGPPRARAVAATGDVAFVEGSCADEAALRQGMRACDGAFVNIDGFNAGERTEMFWAIRAYEIALEEGVRFFVYGNLDYTLKKAGYRSEFRTGHYGGKAGSASGS